MKLHLLSLTNFHKIFHFLRYLHTFEKHKKTLTFVVLRYFFVNWFQSPKTEYMDEQWPKKLADSTTAWSACNFNYLEIAGPNPA